MNRLIANSGNMAESAPPKTPYVPIEDSPIPLYENLYKATGICMTKRKKKTLIIRLKKSSLRLKFTSRKNININLRSSLNANNNAIGDFLFMNIEIILKIINNRIGIAIGAPINFLLAEKSFIA